MAVLGSADAEETPMIDVAETFSFDTPSGLLIG